MVKTLPSNNAGGAGLIPGQGTKIPHALRPKKTKTENKCNIVTNSIKTLKMKKKKRNYCIAETNTTL